MSKKITDGLYISAFCKELGLIVRSGIPISDGIFMLYEDEQNTATKEILQQLYEKTAKGIHLSAAIKQIGIFPEYAQQMIEIGENTGKLDAVLVALSDYYQRQEQISRSIKNAVIFPAVLLAVLIIVILILITLVLPVFNEVFKQLGVEMSSLATTMLNIGNTISSCSTAIVIAIVIIAAAAFALAKIPLTRAFFKNIYDEITKNGKINRKMCSARFASVMAMTLSSGMDIDESINMAAKLTTGKAMSKRIEHCKELMNQGKSFDYAVAHSDIFTSLNSRMLTISFKTGLTDEVMREIADSSEEQMNEQIDSTVSKIEPTLVIIMSVLVGLILLSVMLPLLSIITSV